MSLIDCSHNQLNTDVSCTAVQGHKNVTAALVVWEEMGR